MRISSVEDDTGYMDEGGEGCVTKYKQAHRMIILTWNCTSQTLAKAGLVDDCLLAAEIHGRGKVR